jgi:hypothetical protein
VRWRLVIAVLADAAVGAAAGAAVGLTAALIGRGRR